MTVSELLGLLQEAEDAGHGSALVVVDGLDVSDVYVDDSTSTVNLTVYSALPDYDDTPDEGWGEDACPFYYEEWDE